MLNGALFVYIQSGTYVFEIIDENGPYTFYFPAPPMAMSLLIYSSRFHIRR